MFRNLLHFSLLLFFCLPAYSIAAEADAGGEESAAADSETILKTENKETSFKIIDAGPGFGAHWLTENGLAFAYMEYDVRKKFPFNNLVFTKIRYDGQLGGVNDIIKIPIGNSIMETSAHFVYDARFRQLGYMISNAADRFGSAHGLQIGMLHLNVEKSRVYLESPYYLNDGYDQINGVSMSPDQRGFIASYSGDLYFIPFGDPGSRDKPQISDIYSESYLPWFDDSTIGAELLRQGQNSRYPVFFTNDEILIYENNDILLYNIRTKATNLVVTVGEGVKGMTISINSKQIAVLKAGVIIRFDIAGNVLDKLDTGIKKARNLSWNPDERYFAFDDIEKIYIVELEPDEPMKVGEAPIKPVRSIPQLSQSCGSAERIMEIRRSLEAEINGLRNDVSDTKLIGIHKVSAQLRQLANCQSTIVRGGSSSNVNTVMDEDMPAKTQPRTFTQESTIVVEPAASVKGATDSDPLIGSKFQVLEQPESAESSTSESTSPDRGQAEKFKVIKPDKKSFNKFRDSPDMF